MTQYSLYEHNTLNLRPLRPKQAAAIEAIRQAVKEGHRRIILQAPCAFGKTLTSAHIVASSMGKGKRPIFTAPAITLVEQTLKAFEYEGIRDIGVMQAQHDRTNWNAQLQIASVQTLIRRALPDVDLILIDEAHLVWKKLNERLDSEEWKNKVAIGLTATPWTKGMGLRWTKLIIAATTQEMIDDGHLSPFVVYVPDHNLNRAKLKVVAGEFQEKSASEAMSDSVIIGDVVKTWQEYSGGGKTFMFCVNRAHAKEQMKAFLDAGIPFGYIDALTPMDERTTIFRQMREGKIAGIASVGCLIQGVDEDCRTIIDAAPTRSLARHVQKIGRGLRIADGKDHCVILDHAGNTLALGMVTDINISELDHHKPGEKGEIDKEAKVPKPRKCEKCHALIPPGKGVCPLCGTKVVMPSGVQNQDGDMVLFSGGKQPKKKQETNRNQKQYWYSELLGLAKERGYASKWADHRYKEKFGVWPNGLNAVPLFPSTRVRRFDQDKRREWAKQREGVA
jgi:DNA repair protein RadD